MKKIISKDGTAIAFDQPGQGSALIFVTGAIAVLSDVVSQQESPSLPFTIFAYDRRGRGDSTDTLPYAVEREVEDIDALITEAGGSAFVCGYSSGAVLALEAARLLPTKITKLAVYEPPFIIDDSRPPVPDDYVTRLTELVSSGRRGEAVEYFLTKAVGVPPEAVAQMRTTPLWEVMEMRAHTLVYVSTMMGDTMSGNPLSIRKWASVTIPTLVMHGGKSPDWLQHGAQALVDILPNAQHHRFPDQDHYIALEVLFPVLVEFFQGFR